MFFTSFFVTILLCGSFCGAVIVDRHSREIGWNECRTVFAFSSNGKRLNLTLLGRRYAVEGNAVKTAEQILGGLERGLGVLEPSPLRLWQEAQAAVKIFVSVPVKEFFGA